MAYENIRLNQPNFCLGPQVGTFCTIDTTNPQTVLRVKNTAGANILDLSLSSNIINDNIRLEYVGPLNLSSMIDGLNFFTFEKVNNSSCIIKRWETRLSYSELLLKEQIVKTSSGNERYNAIDFAVEYHFRTFTKPNEYYNYLDMNSTANVKNGTKLFMGPSSDTTNLGATETATVSHIINYIDGKRVYLTQPLTYEYAIGDRITFYSHVYVYSSEGYAGDSTKGTLFKFDAYTWNTTEIDTKTIYKKVNSSRWCPTVGGIASIIYTNMLFVRPYDSYQNWRSMFLDNIEDDYNTYFPVYDVVFDNYSIYKLQAKTTLRTDSGLRETYSWWDYNYQADTLLPYVNTMALWKDQSILTGYHKNIDIYAQTRDQFHATLRDVPISFFKDGDTEALFDPLSGNVTTDTNGTAVINYRSGSIYNGHTDITARAVGGSSSKGSTYVWGESFVVSLPETTPATTNISSKVSKSGFVRLKEIWEYYKFLDRENEEWTNTFLRMPNKSYFMSPGGDWGPSVKLHDYEPNYSEYYDPDVVAEWLPMLYRGDGQHFDGPRNMDRGSGFSPWPWPESFANEVPFFIGDRITLLSESEGQSRINSLTDFLLYDKGSSNEGYPPYIIVCQPDETGHGQISQLNLSLHTHWVDGEPYDELFTYVDVDQFIFVEDAIPKFWSEKNPITTDIWIRLRPFAFSLDNSTLRMWVREDSYEGDTGYYEVTDQITLQNFDAGSGLLGIEVTYNPPQDFLYGSVVYVKIEVYDEAYIPNFIYTNYWFKVIPDYKSPYLINKLPDGGAIDVPVDTDIYFEIKEEGTGIDEDTLEILLNSRRVDTDYLTINKVSRYHFKVTYNPPENLYFGKDYKVTVKVSDTSPRENAMNSSYSFSTVDSTGVSIVDPVPGVCKRGMPRFSDVSVVVLGDGNGVDLDTIRMQVYNRDVHPRIVPVIYRIS